MASLDSANGPSATVRPFRAETILPSRSSGWPALHFPSCVNRSNQAYHWVTIFWTSSGERSLSQCVPRNRSMYSFCACVFIIAFPLLGRVAHRPVQRMGRRLQDIYFAFSFLSQSANVLFSVSWHTAK